MNNSTIETSSTSHTATNTPATTGEPTATLHPAVAKGAMAVGETYARFLSTTARKVAAAVAAGVVFIVVGFSLFGGSQMSTADFCKVANNSTTNAVFSNPSPTKAEALSAGTSMARLAAIAPSSVPPPVVSDMQLLAKSLQEIGQGQPRHLLAVADRRRGDDGTELGRQRLPLSRRLTPGAQLPRHSPSPPRTTPGSAPAAGPGVGARAHAVVRAGSGPAARCPAATLCRAARGHLPGAVGRRGERGSEASCLGSS